MDREKVIKGLEECAGNGNCTKCQYGKEKQALSCKKLLADALELVKSSRLIHTEHACKDCGFAFYKEGLVQEGYIFCTKPGTERGQAVKPDDWFCADRKRKDT